MSRSTIKMGLFADDKRREKLDSLGNPLVFLERHMGFAALVAEVGRGAPRPVSESSSGRPQYPTETPCRIWPTPAETSTPTSIVSKQDMTPMVAANAHYWSAGT